MDGFAIFSQNDKYYRCFAILLSILSYIFMIDKNNNRLIYQ